MSKLIKYFLVLVIVSMMAGCATRQPNVTLPDNFWETKNQKIAIAQVVPAQPQEYQAAEQGLLWKMIEQNEARPVNEYLKTINLEWYYAFSKMISKKLNSEKISTVLVAKPINSGTSEDIESIAAKTKTKNVLVITLDAVGTMQFPPPNSPEAYCAMKGELINTDTKQVLWRYQVETSQPVAEPWDQPPSYPNLTKAISLAANDAKRELLDSLFSGT